MESNQHNSTGDHHGVGFSHWLPIYWPSNRQSRGGKVAVFSLVAYALSVFIASYFVVSLWSFYLIALSTAVVALGSTPLAFTRTITRYFDASRGLALGISLMSTGVVAALAPAILAGYVDEYGWRSGYRCVALFVLSMALIVGLFIKDEEKRNTENIETRRIERSSKITSNNYLTDNTFIKLACIFFLVALSVSGTIVHFIPMLLHLNVGAIEAGKIASVLGISVMLGRLMTGILIDRFHAPTVAATLFGLSSIGYIVFILGGSNYSIFIAIAIGISMGAEVDLISYLVSRYFGLNKYGVIYGSLYAIFLVGASISPLLLAFLFDTNGSYSQALSFATLALVFASLLCMSLRPFPQVDRHG